MPRRGGVPKRDVLPDPLYKSKVVTKLINQVMYDGKKGVAQRIVYDAFDIKTKRPAARLSRFSIRPWRTSCRCLRPRLAA